MPLYDYLCRACGHWQLDQFHHLAADAPRGLPCPRCGEVAEKMPGLPATMGSTYTPGLGRIFGTAEVSGAHNVWAGTKLADSDGKNRYHYKSKKAQVDLGHHKGA